MRIGALTRLRMLWKSGMPVQQPPSATVTPDALALVPAGSIPGAGTKLTAAGREQMQRKLEKDYTSCVVTRETLPALCFLQSIHQQAADKFFEWSGGASSARNSCRRSKGPPGQV